MEELNKNSSKFRVLKHRVKKQKIVNFKNFFDLCNSGYITKAEAISIATESVSNIEKIIKSANFTKVSAKKE
jgi:hypothetical protein